MAVQRQPVKADGARWKPVVRAFPENMEVLTEHGFMKFSDLCNTSLLGAELPFEGSKNAAPFLPMTQMDWNQWATGSDFPLLATVDPVSGSVSYVKPERLLKFSYTGKLVHVKAKGLDFYSTLFADLFVRPLYGRGFKFVLADNVFRDRSSSSSYAFTNKFNQDLYGEYVPLEGLKALMGNPITVRPLKHVRLKKIWEVFAYMVRDSQSARMVKADRARTEVDCFNVVVGPHHNIIVRLARKDNNPRTLWVGSPVVVGDALDKSIVRVAAVREAWMKKRGLNL
jgi:hypothetical protein